MANDATSPSNQLLQEVQYKVDVTAWGTWRKFLYPNGQLFAEFTSHANFFGLPWLHFTSGKCPETGRRIVAKGVVAVGRLACGIIAIGQAALGVIAVGQLALGAVFGLGQAGTGIVAVGQLAVGVALGIGQFAVGHVAVGQLAWGHYVLAQLGIGDEVWDTRGVSPLARQFFEAFLP